MLGPMGRRFGGALLLIAVFACACTGSGSPSPAGNTKLIVDKDFGSYDSLDPARGSVVVPIMVDKSVYDTLMRINPSDLSKPYPSLATSYDASSDGKTFTFHLRHGVKFANGDPLTSGDVLFSLARVAGINGLGAGSVPALTASAPDPYTVVITRPVSDPALPVEMTVFNASILDSKLVQQNGGTTDKSDKAEDYLNGPNQAGSGPYVLTSVDRTSQIILKANPLYWGPQPKYTTIILHHAPAATQSLDIQDGQAQVAVDILPTETSSLNSSVKVTAAPTSDAVNLWLNIDPKVSPLSSNQDFRDAVRYGLDYQGILALEGKGAVQGTGFLPRGFLGSLPASDAPKRDLTRAKASLAKVGVTNPTITLEYPTDFIVDGVQPGPIVAKIQSDLKEVGINVVLSGKPSAVDISEAIASKYAMWFCPNSADYPDPSDFLLSAPGGLVASAFGNRTGVNPQLDSLVTAAQSAVQPADRKTAYQALATAINGLEYTTMLFQPSRVLVTAKSVNATINPFTYLDFGSIT